MNSLTKTELMKSIVTGISAAVPMLIGALVMGFAGPKMIGKAMTNALKNAGIVFISYILGHFIISQFSNSSVVLGIKPDVFTGAPGF